jgi:hypothetical protein
MADNGDRPPLPTNWPRVDGELRQAFDDFVEGMPPSTDFTKATEMTPTAEMITMNLRQGWTTPLTP